jgi:hypothetical protein
LHLGLAPVLFAYFFSPRPPARPGIALDCNPSPTNNDCRLCSVSNREKPVYAPYVEHVPPDVTACTFWLKNRDLQHWRDSQQVEHVISRPMIEKEWTGARRRIRFRSSGKPHAHAVELRQK